jgi:hypothetical protein
MSAVDLQRGVAQILCLAQTQIDVGALAWAAALRLAEDRKRFNLLCGNRLVLSPVLIRMVYLWDVFCPNRLFVVEALRLLVLSGAYCPSAPHEPRRFQACSDRIGRCAG